MPVGARGSWGSRVMAKTGVPTLATPRNYIDGKRRERGSWGSQGGRILTLTTSHQSWGRPRSSRMVIHRFLAAPGRHESPGAFVQKPQSVRTKALECLYESPGPAGPAGQKQKAWS